jgi:hypothetical protein
VSPFDYLNSINDTKKDVMVDDIAEKQYNGFMVNRGLSYFSDTVLLANEMNLHHQLPKRLQYSFLLESVRKRKRFSKWLKPEQFEDLDLIKMHYGYSNEKARAALSLLTAEQIEAIRASHNRGGIKK